MFFTRALRAGTVPVEVTTDRALVYPRVLDELVPHALHRVEQYANPVEADHGRLKPDCDRCVVSSSTDLPRRSQPGTRFVQNLKRGHYDTATGQPQRHRLRVAFAHLALAV
jgi:transposase-like protein